MGELLRTILWGRTESRQRRWKLFVGVYGVCLAVLFGLSLAPRLFGAVDLATTLHYSVLPVLVFYSPALVATIAAYRREGLILCLGVGLTPIAVVGVLFTGADVAAMLQGNLPPGDSPTWALLLAYSIFTLGAALLGFLTGSIVQLVAKYVRKRNE